MDEFSKKKEEPASKCIESSKREPFLFGDEDEKKCEENWKF